MEHHYSGGPLDGLVAEPRGRQFSAYRAADGSFVSTPSGDGFWRAMRPRRPGLYCLESESRRYVWRSWDPILE
jgi:hypothetical protein